MNENLIIIGASGHGKVIADIAVNINKWENIYFLDDSKEVKSCLGFKVIDTVDKFINYKESHDFFVAIGNNEIRERITKRLEKEEVSIATLIHPNVVIANEVEIKQGTAVMAGVVINSDTKIGKGCIINTSSSIDHDNTIKDFVHISPGVHLAGNVEVGKSCWLGIGSAVINNVNIHNNIVIGAGSVIVKSLELSGKYFGSPAFKKSAGETSIEDD